VSLQIAVDLVILLICATCKCNTVGTLDIISNDGKMIYLSYLGGHTSNPTDEGILDSNTNSKQSEKRISIRNHLLDYGKELR